MFRLIIIIIALLALHLAKATPHADNHAPLRKRLPENWFQPDDHHVHALFKRQSPPTDGITYPTVGSPEWVNAYPSGVPDVTKLPQAWVDALNAAVAAGKIPNIPPSQNLPNQNPTYPNGIVPTSPQVCSGTYKCRIPGDIWDAPQGQLGCGFDDGPLPASDRLYQFLQQNNQHATHFFIGINILNNPNQFLTAFQTLQDDIAVHTWTHPYMTTLNNLQVLAQLGWSIEIIHNSTGGRLPKFWRPPYGDTDVRVKAIASEVFGMTTILWNQDTEDWSLTSGGTTPQKINSSMTQWLTGPKNPGLIILEHELSDPAVTAFINAYPVMKANGWNVTSAAQLAGAVPYQNSASSNSPVTPDGVLVGNVGSSGAPSGTTATASASVLSSSTSKTSSSSSAPSGGSSGSSTTQKSSGLALRTGKISSSWIVSGISGVMAFTAVVPLFA